MALPPNHELKSLNICFCGETINDGVFSFWKGLRPEKLLPALLRGTYLLTISTISMRERMSSVSWDIKPMMNYKLSITCITLVIICICLLNGMDFLSTKKLPFGEFYY